MKIKTSELTGAALDWVVASCEKQRPSISTGELYLYEHNTYLKDFVPSSSWCQGGPIVEREKISTIYGGCYWEARIYHTHNMTGATALIAAMRCYVASKLGDEVDVPDEIVQA